MDKGKDNNSGLTDAFAMFIGDAFVSCDGEDADELVAPFRFNKNNKTVDIQKELNSYQSLIKYLATQTGMDNYLRQVDNGFDVVFPLPEGINALDYLFAMAKEVKAGSQTIKENFLIGVYDGRGTPDGRETIGTIAVDLPKDNDLATIVDETIVQVGESIDYTFIATNPERERSGKNRKSQLRLTAGSARRYISELGFYSPKKIKKILSIGEFAKQLPRKKDDLLAVRPIVLANDGVADGSVDELIDSMLRDIQLSETAEEASYLKSVSLADQSGNAVEVKDEPQPRRKKKDEINGESAYPRNVDVAVRAIKLAGHQCELAGCERELFIREKDGMPYLEPHHLIPLSRNDDFGNSLDVEANVIALCSSCHNEIHYGKSREILIRELYERRIERLRAAGIEVSIEQLISYYNT